MRNVVVCGLLIASVGCASGATPQDLLTARTAYDRASHGPAATLDPADLHIARETLDTAEKSFADKGDTQETRDFAYTADRQAQIAEAHARTLQAEQEKAAVLTALTASQTATVRTTSAALGAANAALQDAERRAAQAAAELARFASVKQEPRGMVITLSGSVLFASAKSDVLPDATGKLDSVAKALGEQDPNSKILVEGYTDSQGGASYNQDLSQRRAASVREYLISHGIAADRVTAQGFGMNSPIADNATPEGRANNRRVEIVVTPTGSK